jgi:hypothetical protein
VSVFCFFVGGSGVDGEADGSRFRVFADVEVEGLERMGPRRGMTRGTERLEEVDGEAVIFRFFFGGSED